MIVPEPSFWHECIEDISSYQMRRGVGRRGNPLGVLIFSRGVHVLWSYRLQRRMLKIPVIGLLLAKILNLFTCYITGCEISYRAEIEGGLYLPHPQGIVIGSGEKVGKNVTILQQVTLGKKDFYTAGAPHIADNVYISAGAKLIGAITVGEGSIVGANAVVLKSVPPQTFAVGVPATLKPLNNLAHGQP